MPAIPGDKVERSLAQSLRYEVSGLLKRDRTTFPGAQPVSFAAKHLIELKKKDFYVCEKTDGIRCLMYLTSDEEDHEAVYLIDRKNDYYYVRELHFPQPGENVEAFHTKTILDGELVNERQEDGSVKLQYLVFDCLVMDGGLLTHREFDKRLAYFREKLFIPYKALYGKYPEELQFCPFTIHFKQVEFGYALRKMFDEILPRLKHGSDGLIFTCRSSPYTPGTDPNILKWKVENENSIDFRMHLTFPTIDPGNGENSYLDYTAVPQVTLTANGGNDRDIKYGSMELTTELWEQMRSKEEPLDERVVECFLEGGKWRWMRFRDDKREANHISTVQSVIESIQDGVTKQDLLNNADQTRAEWKRREASSSVNGVRANGVSNNGDRTKTGQNTARPLQEQT